MNTAELDSYSIDDAVKFNQDLNPRLWRQQRMLPDVREKLLEIAADFKQSLGLTDLEVKDITVSGSNAGYTYTPQSDIDLHLVIDIPQADASDVYRELFDAKKYQYNAEHNITIGGYDVELYVENANQPPVSQGVYSVVQDDWINIPKRRRSSIDDDAVRSKYADIRHRIHSAVNSQDHAQLSVVATKIKKMRTAGLEASGEMGPENLAYKMLRSQGLIKQLYDAKTAARDLELSLNERKKKKKRVRYAYGGYYAPGFAFGNDSGGGGESVQEASVTPDGVSASTKMFVEQDSIKDTDILKNFAQYVSQQLGIEHMPRIVIKRQPEWSEQNGSFGQYVPDLNQLTLSLHGRHIVDVLRTLAHELTHAHQQQTTGIPNNGGNTGSNFENEANARAGEFMRHFADAHPEYFDSQTVSESSGYIPTEAEKNDPRFVMALSPDVQPGATGKNANRMSLRTNAHGRPKLAKTNGLVESMMQEFASYEPAEDLLEIRMTPSSLRAEAAKTGAQAGMEFEMIVPDVDSQDSEPEMEPDYDQDQRARSFSDVRDFFDDGDYNSRREVNDLIEELQGEYEEWLQEQIDEAWTSDGADYMRDYVANNDLFDRDEAMEQARDEIMDANPDLPQESEEFTELLSARLNEMETEFADTAFEDRDRIHNDAFAEFTDEQRENYDERMFLDDKYQSMTDIQSNFDIAWPYYYDINDGQGGGADIDQIADEFSTYMKKPVNASSRYHGARREPGKYVVEPDGSLDGDNPGDTGLEFVSPPMPLDEMIADLNRVKAWASTVGAYTNDSTGLHINISVPNYSIDRLDYVKLALLMGDERVLNEFGRMGNTYTKSATSKIRDILKKNPDLAPAVMDKMRGHMEDIATKAIHSGITDKFTSINTKTGYIEFRSPGGDWLDSNFSIIESTLMRFTVAMSAAIDPAAYRQEYLKKLYKLLEASQDTGEVNVLQLFANYSAGDLDKAALIRQVRVKQLTRDVAKGRTTPGQQFWWRVTNPANSMASIEVVAASKEQAIAKAVEPDNYPDWARVQNTLRATPLRPYQEPESKPAETGNWGIFMINSDRFARAPGQINNNVLRRFPSQAAAMAFLEQTRETTTGMRTDIEVREIPAGYLHPSGPVGIPVNRNTGSTTSGNWGVWVPSLDRFATAGSNIRRFVDQAGAQAWIDDYNQIYPTNDLELQSREIESTMPGQPVSSPVNRNTLTPTGPGPWEVFRTSDGSSIAELGQTNRMAAEVEARSVLDQRQEAPELYGVRTRAPVAQAPQPLTRPGQAQQQFTGEWRILDPEDREIHRFGGVGNVQADANRVAMNWMRQNPGRMQAGVTVVPVMEP